MKVRALFLHTVDVIVKPGGNVVAIRTESMDGYIYNMLRCVE